jgi:hypothetical protein
MLLKKILQAVFEDGKKFQGFPASQLPEAETISDDFLSKADEVVSDHFAVDQNGWDDFSIYPAYVWQRLKRDTFAAGVQGRESLDEAQDIFGYDNPEMFQKELDYLNGFLSKSVVLQPIHLGTGEQGITRRIALDSLAGSAGHWWNGQPSVGRWLVAMADEAIKGPNGD